MPETVNSPAAKWEKQLELLPEQINAHVTACHRTRTPVQKSHRNGFKLKMDCEDQRGVSLLHSHNVNTIASNTSEHPGKLRQHGVLCRNSIQAQQPR